MNSKRRADRTGAAAGITFFRPWGIVVILGVMACVQSASAASFDCTKASTSVEKMICANATISALDDKLSQAYAATAAKASGDDRKRLLAEQKHWLKTTRDVCSSDVCLIHAYWSRQAELDTFFAPHLPLFEHESDQAPAIQKILATAPLYPANYNAQHCDRLFTDLKKMRDIHFVEPVVKTQSYEDPALDSWKRRCESTHALNLMLACIPRFWPSCISNDPYGVFGIFEAFYGTPPFKVFKIPNTHSRSGTKYIFFYENTYGPMNQPPTKPVLGNQFLYFQEFHKNRCESKKNDASMQASASTDATHISYSGIIEHNSQYYMLSLGYFINNYWLQMDSTASKKNQCYWSPVPSSKQTERKRK